MNEITPESQEVLEKDIRKNMTDLGFALYKVPDAVVSYHHVINLHKKLVEYFDNTRLLQTIVKENLSI